MLGNCSSQKYMSLNSLGIGQIGSCFTEGQDYSGLSSSSGSCDPWGNLCPAPSSLVFISLTQVCPTSRMCMPTHTLPSHPSAIPECLMPELGPKPQLQGSLLPSNSWGSSDLADTVSAHAVPCPCWLGHLLTGTGGPRGN